MIKFDLPDDLPSDILSALRRCWFAGGYDFSPVPVRRKLDDKQLILIRDDNESGHLQLAWPAAPGNPVVTTATLRLRDEPYQLLPELCRGTVNRVRNLLADLAFAGIPFPADTLVELSNQIRAFGRLILDIDRSTTAAQNIISTCTELANQGTAAYSRYRLEARLKAAGRLPTWFGCRVSQPLDAQAAEAYTEAFTAIRIVPDWSQLEPQEADFHWESLDPLVHWAAEAGLGVSIGPLIDLTSGTLPGWLSAWNGDMLSLTAFMSDFIGTIVNRYKSQVRVWQLFSGFNQTDACGLVEDNRVRLAARLLDTAKEVDPDGVWIIGVSQPWGEYLTTAGQNYSPLIFADTLLRAGYKIGGIELEILPESVAGRGSHRRDLLGFVQLIDLFDHLSIPLEITTGDQLSRGEMPGVVTAAVAAPTVQAFYWDGWSAQDQCGRVPGGSIWNGSAADGTLEAFRGFRQSWLR